MRARELEVQSLPTRRAVNDEDSIIIMAPLSSTTCAGWLRDPDHLFASMWGSEPWTSPRNGSRLCWQTSRDTQQRAQPATLFVTWVKSGQYCKDNWMLGNAPRNRSRLLPALAHLTQIGHPEFAVAKAFAASTAPALVGFDHLIHRHCSAAIQTKVPYLDFEHAAACVAANRSILWLKQDAVGRGKVGYNLCRNLEWIDCAAGGRLPGQQGQPGHGELLIALPAGPLDSDGEPPFDGCRKVHANPGFSNNANDATSAQRASHCPDGARSYSSSDVLFLEICLLSQICQNGEELFALPRNGVGGTARGFRCQYSEALRDRVLDTLMRTAESNRVRRPSTRYSSDKLAAGCGK